MAEVALGVAGSVVGIVSLAGQVCAGIQELYALLDSVKDSELDMKCIKDDVILFQNTHYIRESAPTGTVGGASDPVTAVISSGEPLIKQDPTWTKNSNGENYPMRMRRPNRIIDTDTSEVEYQFLLGTLSNKLDQVVL
ncbi:uncharacterized protein N7496_006613 [Penicillium cataractarum]|uniref:Uncharacterized protein n=1 Tax=Penicillium cataractarum TaxID=2100454 RepID=A0A9W9S1Z5_9EURO|nr:uncharacterized protein N7496_006613 [Penicillium cataractarum]KAJ5370521.1 hypothetical protein N7496_006613 [Penicillium cataractarum]